MSIYTDNDYEDREEYLRSLANGYGVSMETVIAISSVLGEIEDFDGLVCELEDYVMM